MKKKSLVMGLVLALGCSLALAQVKVGVTVSATGPAASLGMPEKNTVDLLPREIAGQKIEYLVLDDASDTTSAVNNTRKFITENQVDLVMGSTISPNALAMIDVVAEARVPMIAFAASEKIVSPVDDKRRWVFKTAQNDRMMAEAIVEHMAANGVKTVGFIGYSDAYGESWYQSFSEAAAAKGLQLVVNERYNRTDTSVTGQVLKIVGAKPDAVLIAGSGTPAALPQKTLKERGYAGKIYQTHGVVNPDFLRVCGRDCEGTFLPSSPVVVAPQLPDSHPAKAAGVEYFQLYESKYGKGRQQPDFELLRAMVHYVAEYPERSHHPKEDRFLFARLKEKTHEADAVIARLEQEHAANEKRVAELQEALRAYAAGEAGGFETFKQAFGRYADFYRQHMITEEREILPLARRVFSAEDWEAVEEGWRTCSDPLAGVTPNEDWEKAFRELVMRAPPPIGLGPTPL